MTPKPLDLKEDEIKENFEVWYYSKKVIPHGLMWSNWSYDGYKAGVNFMRQQIKSACEFYLRYKDNPELFTSENYGEIRVDYEKKLFLIIKNRFLPIEKYNEWLFKLAFKEVLEK